MKNILKKVFTLLTAIIGSVNGIRNEVPTTLGDRILCVALFTVVGLLAGMLIIKIAPVVFTGGKIALYIAAMGFGGMIGFDPVGCLGACLIMVNFFPVIACLGGLISGGTLGLLHRGSGKVASTVSNTVTSRSTSASSNSGYSKRKAANDAAYKRWYALDQQKKAEWDAIHDVRRGKDPQKALNRYDRWKKEASKY